MLSQRSLLGVASALSPARRLARERAGGEAFGRTEAGKHAPEDSQRRGRLLVEPLECYWGQTLLRSAGGGEGAKADDGKEGAGLLLGDSHQNCSRTV